MKELLHGAKESISETTQRLRDQAQQASDTVQQKNNNLEAKITKSVGGLDQDYALENAADAEHKTIDTVSDGKECSDPAMDAKEREHETEKGLKVASNVALHHKLLSSNYKVHIKK